MQIARPAEGKEIQYECIPVNVMVHLPQEKTFINKLPFTSYTTFKATPKGISLFSTTKKASLQQLSSAK